MFQKLIKTLNRTSAYSFSLIALSMILIIAQPIMASESSKSASKINSAPEVSEPFAKVYLALQGCTSCAACRSVIRKMAKGTAEDGKVSLPSDAVEINYAEPTTIPLKKVVDNLAKNRLHNLKLVDVLFDVSGKIAAIENGVMMFTIETTGQQYAISIPEGITAPPEDKTFRLSAVVQGWRDSDADLTLKMKTFSVIN